MRYPCFFGESASSFPLAVAPGSSRSDEPARLAALRATRLLDTAPEDTFDGLTRIAADALRVPIALVSLVDAERQWFKSRCGLDAAETPRSASFCAHAIREDGMMVVPDAAADPRFADTPLVTGDPHIRFYAGVPLLGPEGHPLGTFCVIDRVPRTLTEAEARILAGLAATAQEFIRLRQVALAAAAVIYPDGAERNPSLESELRTLLTRDPLTGFPHRAELEAQIRRALPDWRAAEALATVAVIDVDNFDGINGTLTYGGGDGVLIELSRRLRGALGANDLVARIGGDTFVALLRERAGDDLSARLERLWQASQFCMESGARRLDVSCGIGFSRFPADGDDPDTLINAACAAVRQAKRTGRGALQPYGAGACAAQDDYELEHDLGRALANGELELHYQPKVDLATERVMGVEALVRWHHPRRGAVPPDVFIPLAERSGLIVPLSEWIVDAACAALRRWRAGGIDGVSMAINLSSRLFAAVGLVPMIASALRRHDLPGSVLDLEVTETGAIADLGLAARLMRQLKALGPTISVDDFGTGYAGLSYLKDFPVDAIKIDRSFVSDLPHGACTRALVQGMIATGRGLGLTVVAEGVETDAQRDLLRGAGCDIVQGYFYSRPLAEAACRAFLARDRGLPAVP